MHTLPLYSPCGTTENAAEQKEREDGDAMAKSPHHRMLMPVLPRRPISCSPLPSPAPPRALPLPANAMPALPLDALFLGRSNTFQNLRFSSLDAVATVVPSGLRHEWSTRVSCACVMSTTFESVGKDQIESWLSGNPCDDSTSRACGLKMMEVTWEGVTSELRRADVVVFQKLRACVCTSRQQQHLHRSRSAIERTH